MERIQVSTHFAEETSARAEVVIVDGVYHIEYYDFAGSFINSAAYPNHSPRLVENIASQWTHQVKPLNG